jgi:hypothetical protein
VKLYGPTYFNQIISLVNDMCDYDNCTQEDQKYYILLIITDGNINDMEDTIDQIVRGTTLPLSIIIVGVGDEDFSEMIRLDADTVPLYSQKYGKQMER